MQTGRYAGRKAGRQTEMQAGRQVSRQACRKAGRQARQAFRACLDSGRGGKNTLFYITRKQLTTPSSFYIVLCIYC